MTSGVVAISVPVGAWWYWARQERDQKAKAYLRSAERFAGLAGSQDTFDLLISEKCRPGDVLLFDRRCENCAAGPWEALHCLLSKGLLTDPSDGYRCVEEGRFDHIGLIVPGYVTKKEDEYDSTNLLLLEATPSGIVARPLKERLERSFSRTILLLPLACPGERRNKNERDEGTMVESTRAYVKKELNEFRDKWVELGSKNRYGLVHSTIGIGGAIINRLGLQGYSAGPVSPSAYIVLMGLIKAAAAQNVNEKDNLRIKVEDFLRDHRYVERDSIRLRPGWKFLKPIALKERSQGH